ncbi:hypothetical protein H0H87_008515 [Tephrocybe sp. NHM501043]|nr:hypothetical protein H0H87_008515 [Tephrocybe sp. NHM501043]
MLTSQVQVASIVALFVSQVSAGEIIRPLVARANGQDDSRGIIPALLRTAKQAEAGAIARRASCGLSYFACEDATGGLCGRDASERPICHDKNGNSASVVYTTTTAAHTSTKTSTSLHVDTTTYAYATWVGGSDTEIAATTTPTISPTVYTFASTTITGPLHNGGDATPTTTSQVAPASGLVGNDKDGAMALVGSASTVIVLASFVATLLAQY